MLQEAFLCCDSQVIGDFWPSLRSSTAPSDGFSEFSEISRSLAAAEEGELHCSNAFAAGVDVELADDFLGEFSDDGGFPCP